MPSLFRCAHISDLHFSKPSWGLSQFFSKRWLGNLNFFFSRQREYASENLYALTDLFLQRGVTHVLITGDLSTTSTKEEFRLAQDFVATLKKGPFKVFVLPGNHDQYTRKAYQEQLFYQFFKSDEPTIGNFRLHKEGVEAFALGPRWWLVMLDTALATSWISSCGLFASQLEENLEKTLALIPPQEHVILANHFPFFPHDHPRKILKRGEALQALIERHLNIRFYLHGHTHRHCIADLQVSGLPIVVDSGSTAHKKLGTWNLIDIGEEGSVITPFSWKEGAWMKEAPHPCTWALS